MGNKVFLKKLATLSLFSGLGVFFCFYPLEDLKAQDLESHIKFYWDFDKGIELEVPVEPELLPEKEDFVTTFKTGDSSTSSKDRFVSVHISASSSESFYKEEESDTEDPEDEDKDQEEEDSDSEDEDKDQEEEGKDIVYIAELKNLDEGEEVKTEGVVVAEPGLFGLQYFYIADSLGLQVYNYHQDFPDLELGDRVRVNGEVSVSHGEKRLNTSDIDDIKVLGQEEVPSPLELDMSEVSDNDGNFVSITGELSDSESDRFYLKDGSEEIMVYSKDRLDLSDISEGDEVEVVGLVNMFRSEPRILPRDDKDISVLSSVLGDKTEVEEEKEKEEEEEEEKEEEEKQTSPKKSSDKKEKEPEKQELEKEELEEQQEHKEEKSFDTQDIITPVTEVKELEEGSSVTTRGTVAVEPGVLGSQYFYITGSPGLQIYNYHQDFPDLNTGDYIEVKGEVSVSHGEKRINTSSAKDMKVISQKETPQSFKIDCSDLRDNTGNLVSVKGEVLEVQANKFYLGDDEGEIEVFVRDHLDISGLSEGDKVEVTGLVNKFRSEPRLLPRSDKDLVKLSDDPDIKEEDLAQVLDSQTSNPYQENLVLSSDSGLGSWTKYLSEALFGVVIVLLIVLIREQRISRQES